MEGVLKSENVNQRALRILESGDFFGDLRNVLTRGGLVGEEQNALAAYVVATSRLLQNPLNVLIKGRSSAGKNYLANSVLQLLPKRDVKTLSSSSAMSWNYFGDNLRHRVVYLKEHNEQSGPIHPGRLLISEGQLIRTVAERVAGGFKTVRKVTRGPVSCFSTTTKKQLQIDDETRNLSIHIDESEEQTRRIAKAQAEGERRIGVERRERAAWREAQGLLAARAPETSFFFPGWFKDLAEFVDASQLAARRCFPAFMTACQAIALIRSFRSALKSSRSNRLLPIRFSDYAIASILFGKVLSVSSGIDCGSSSECEPGLDLQTALEQIGTRSFRAADLAEKLSISLDQAYAILRRASQSGLVVRANPPEYANRKFYRAASRKEFLPDPHELFMHARNVPSRVRFIHPLTGEEIVYRARRWRECE